MRFVHPELLWLLLLLPLLAILKGKRGPSPALIFSSTILAAALAGSRKNTTGRILATFKLLALGCLIAALARPQLGNTTTEIEASGIDILLAVDVSGSMKAMDFTLRGKPVSRLKVVKSVVDQFIEDRPNDRIGLIAFSGKPYLVSPLTLDHDWLRKRLDALSIGMIEDGTAIGSAIGTGVKRLHNQKAKSHILILLTDGMNNSGKIPPLAAAEAAQALKIKVYTVGAGTRGEAPFPVTDAFGRKRLVNSRVDIDEKTLTTVAEMTGAQYFRATDTSSLANVYEEINTLETTTRTIKQFEHYRELFPLMIWGCLLFLGLGIFFRRNHLP